MEVAIYALNKVNPFFKIFSIFLIWFSLGEQIIIEQNVTWYELLCCGYQQQQVTTRHPVSRRIWTLGTKTSAHKVFSSHFAFCCFLISCKGRITNTIFRCCPDKWIVALSAVWLQKQTYTLHLVLCGIIYRLLFVNLVNKIH